MGGHRFDLFRRDGGAGKIAFAALAVWSLLTLVGSVSGADDGWNVLSVQPKVLGQPDAAASAPAAAPAPGVESPEVGVSLLAVPLAAAAGDPFVSVVVELRGGDLLKGTATGELRGRIDVQAVDAQGASRGTIQQPFLLPLDEDTRASLESAGLKLFGTLRVPPGSYRLDASVIAGELQAHGRASIPVSVPNLREGAPWVSPALVPHSLDRWKAFQQSQGGYAEAGYAYVAPGGAAFMPSARPALPSGSPVDFYLIGYGMEDTAVSARVLDAQGRLVASPALEIGAREPGDRPGEQRLRATLAPLDLPRGSYSLEIDAGGARSTLPVDLVAASDASVDADAMVAATVRAEEPEIEVEPVDPGEVREVEARYAEIVAGLEEGDFELTARRLVAFERQVLSPGSKKRNKALRTLRKAQKEVADQLVHRSTESLLPLLYLHFLADDLYQEEGNAWTVAQNRGFFTELVDLYAKREGRAGARRGAQLLAAVGVPSSALDLEPDNALALLRLGLSQEKAGQHRYALDFFERLVAIRPRDPHARLRLAVNLRRTGQKIETARAREIFRGLLASPAPDWIRIVAYQELAEIEMETRGPRAAEALLRQGVEETEDQSLLIQLAHVLDKERRRDDAVAVLNRLAARDDGSVSARHRYNGPPLDELAAARAEILAMARGGLPALSLAMNQTSAFRFEVSS